MPGFDFICPMNYPNKCDLSQTVVDSLQASEGEKTGFLMYQFQNKDQYLVETIKKKFKSWNCLIREAASEPGTGIKFCKVCRLATASDFGIGVLTPENLNVYLELGLIWGQGKDILLLANPKKLPKGKSLNDLRFDVNAFMVIEYKSKNELEEKLDIQAPPFLDRVRVMGIYQQELVKSVRHRLKLLKQQKKENIEFLKVVLLMGKEQFGSKLLQTYIRVMLGTPHDFHENSHQYMSNLGGFGFVECEDLRRVQGRTEAWRYHFNLTLLHILCQEAFKEI
ncbi:hypothetical protein CEE37_14820 [candidate division LCP-89 bacterium B3_LCP]|uniref:Uncharacterized protein n=1 Tax=candidate division LCP-89 bacterium B3_LCP TaxID=2012998 RepID=A0A532UPI9_UNCL8|nr:MAG: hypothetical protein CEE37_14820 [candidate division LCP-89 bacterium B3_LCP]